jgi:hypothetical protein
MKMLLKTAIAAAVLATSAVSADQATTVAHADPFLAQEAYMKAMMEDQMRINEAWVNRIETAQNAWFPGFQGMDNSTMEKMMKEREALIEQYMEARRNGENPDREALIKALADQSKAMREAMVQQRPVHPAFADREAARKVRRDEWKKAVEARRAAFAPRRNAGRDFMKAHDARVDAYAESYKQMFEQQRAAMRQHMEAVRKNIEAQWKAVQGS